ncbi:MAG: Fic family protein [Lachnospiraceae bacterium]|nr:Fic family protein [Lachnospiraceae bacterium]
MGKDSYIDLIDNESKIIISSRLHKIRNIKFNRITYDVLLKIHKELFDGIFPFAGKLRDVNMSKGDTIFCLYKYIDEELKKYFIDFSKDNELKGLSKERFCRRAACYYGDLNFIHPFREGNGRTLRELFYHIGKNSGYELDLTKCNKEEYLKAVIESEYKADSLNELMLSIVKPIVQQTKENNDLLLKQNCEETQESEIAEMEESVKSYVDRIFPVKNEKELEEEFQRERDMQQKSEELPQIRKCHKNGRC